MEEQYWQQFMKSGDVMDYLGYKMEVYGHNGNSDKSEQPLRSNSVESDRIDRNGAFNGTDWRI